MTLPYPKPIQDAAKLLTQELSKAYPSIINTKYDSYGVATQDEDGMSFEARMQMGIYIELIKAGAFSYDEEK